MFDVLVPHAEVDFRDGTIMYLGFVVLAFVLLLNINLSCESAIHSEDSVT